MALIISNQSDAPAGRDRLAVSNNSTTNFEDVIQVVVGASALAVPIAFSEEAWNLSRTLPIQNTVFLVFLSVLFLGLYSFQSIFQGNIKHRVKTFIYRNILDYCLTLFVVFIVLLALNRMPVISETIVAIKRVLILSFPASMGAVVVDSFDKE